MLLNCIITKFECFNQLTMLCHHSVNYDLRMMQLHMCTITIKLYTTEYVLSFKNENTTDEVQVCFCFFQHKLYISFVLQKLTFHSNQPVPSSSFRG